VIHAIPEAWHSAAPVAAAGAWALVPGLRGAAEGRAFAGSCAVIAGLLAGAALSVFPVIPLSTLAPEHSMTAYNGAGPAHGLAVALFWWPVAFVLAFTYLVVILREYRGKVRPNEDTQGYS
jgi:cytochrome bd-type quinol oxidase subunit 2